tara:strand:- start:575 stop:709 length:135 start_codon:yes stop_codon:yes gene_type:complete
MRKEKANIDKVAEINVEDFSLIMNLKVVKTNTLISNASGNGSII